jgi:hypothetical protein
VFSNQSSKLSGPKQVKTWVQLLAVLIGILPLYSSLIIYQIQKGQPPSNQGFIFYLAGICPVSIVIALMLLRFLCKESYSGLNLKPGRLYSDLLSTLILAFVILVTNVISQYLLSELLPTSTSDSNIRNLFREMTTSPGLLFIFVGPLVFLGAASEELISVPAESSMEGMAFNYSQVNHCSHLGMSVRFNTCLSGANPCCMDDYLRLDNGLLLLSVWSRISTFICTLLDKRTSGNCCCTCKIGFTIKESISLMILIISPSVLLK